MQAEAVTSAIWTRLESVRCLHHSKHIISLLYFQTTGLCTRRQMTYVGMSAALSPALGRSWARWVSQPTRGSLASNPGAAKRKRAWYILSWDRARICSGWAWAGAFTWSAVWTRPESDVGCYSRSNLLLVHYSFRPQLWGWLGSKQRLTNKDHSSMS